MGLPGSGRPPEWQSTHAATANRIVHVRRYAERVRLADEAAGKTP
jgi:predicted Zn-dependent protease